MSSAETDRADRRERNRHTDSSLAEDRQGRDRLRNLADQEVPPSHGDRSANTPGTNRTARSPQSARITVATRVTPTVTPRSRIPPSRLGACSLGRGPGPNGS